MERPVRFLLLSTIESTGEISAALADIHSQYGPLLTPQKLCFSDWERGRLRREEVEAAVFAADLILVAIMGQTELTDYLVQLLPRTSVPVVVLVGASRELLSLTRLGNFSGADLPRREGRFDLEAYLKARKFMDLARKLGTALPIGKLRHMRNWLLACEYYAEGGRENFRHLLLFLLREYFGARVKVEPPRQRPDYGLWWPEDRCFIDPKSFKEAVGWEADKPTVGILFYAGAHQAECLPVVRALIEALRGEANLLPVFSRVEHNLTALRSFFFAAGRPAVDLVVNLQYFCLHGGPYGGAPEPTYQLLFELGVPVLIGFRSYTTEIGEWRQGVRLSPLETTLGVVLPELDGGIDPVYVGGLAPASGRGLLEGEGKEARALPEGIERLCGRLRRWLALRQLPNPEKRLAVILYDYPPGEARLGSAGYLDALESLRVFLEKLAAAGYRVEVPEGDLAEFLLSRGVVNAPEWPAAEPELSVPVGVYRSWYEELPAEVRAEVEKHWGEPPGTVMVRRERLLLPGIVLGNVFLGVQPSRGVHETPDKLYHDRDLPPHHQYLAFYWWLAREFGAHALVHWGTHGTLEFTPGREGPVSRRCFPDILVGDLPHLYYYWVGNPSEATLAKRRSYAVTVSHASPPLVPSGLYGDYLELEDMLAEWRRAPEEERRQLEERLAARAKALSLPAQTSEELELYLYRLKRRLIPRGLHVLDRRLEGEDLAEYLIGLVRFDREVPSLLRVLAGRKGWSYEECLGRPERLRALEEEAGLAVRRWLAGEEEALPPEIARYLGRVRENLGRSRESEGLLTVLEGRYLLPNLGGDPLRSPEVFPVGRNMYEFDPRLIPTVTAQRRGEETVAAVLERFRAAHGRYPEGVGLVLWGFETLSTGGETVAQILAYLGVRLVRKGNPWFKELELIPLDELGRPRIDVLVTICGIFRDLLGPLVELINRAVELAAEAPEPEDMNYVRKHSLRAEAEHGALSRARIFGPREGEYATAVRALVESGAWQGEEELVEAYEGSLTYCHYRGRIAENRKLFASLAATVEVVSQVRHSAEYEFTDLDHYYEFFGGLSGAVARHRGTRPRQWVVDTTEELPEVAEVGLAVDRAVRTRLFNPRWLEGMLAHPFHGGQKVADRVQYLVGLAATTGQVGEWVFREALHRLILDPEVRRRLAENNRFAALEVARRLAEAERRGYFGLTPQERAAFAEAVLELEASVEEST
ncbi:MAG: cobaltochelatase subunit CobN [Moorellales bacterium]